MAIRREPISSDRTGWSVDGFATSTMPRRVEMQIPIASAHAWFKPYLTNQPNETVAAYSAVVSDSFSFPSRCISDKKMSVSCGKSVDVGSLDRGSPLSQDVTHFYK